MNKFAYYMSGYAFKAFSGISKAKINLHGDNNIPKEEGSIIFTANHFTRIETIFLPYHIHQITNRPVWSLAAAELFQGSLKGVLEAMGAVSTRDPQRDFLIVKSLINAQADCIIFPEGMMVKNKKITSDGDFKRYEGSEVQRPRTGAATLALKTEFYRERLRRMIKLNIKEFDRLVDEYQIDSPKDVMDKETFIVPVNITYYPVRAKENVLSKMVLNMMENPSKRVVDELLTEGTMIFSGVDVDIRFGEPIRVRSSNSKKDYFFNPFIESDLTSKRRVNFSNRLSSYHVMRAYANELMLRYMKSVYEMTTLNYDHIFASIMKYISDSSKGIDEYEFRCRAFLATFVCEMALHCNFHTSLYSNQIHILTDDRFKRYEDFIELAIETGVLEKRDGRLYRNGARFRDNYALTMQYDFHTVRVENPIAVIANEVEPLVKLQAYFANLAIKSPSEIALMMSYRIEDKQYNSYLNDFNHYVGDLAMPQNQLHEIAQFSDNFSNEEPRLLKSNSDEVGVLLIHDYLSSPAEMLGFANYLHKKGFTVYLPRLPGHGTAPENLAVTDLVDWVEAVEEGFVLIKSLCKRRVVGGLGVGGVLGLLLGFNVTDIDSIFMVAPPLTIKDYPDEFITSTKLWSQKIKRALLPKGDKDEWIVYLPEISRFRYSTHPVSGVKQVAELLEQLQTKIKHSEKTKQPDIIKSLLLVQSRSNPFISPRSVQKLFDTIQTSFKEYYLFDINSHLILNSNEQDRVLNAIVGFIEASVI
ncbi:MAG: alpha/beta fold hydrolase [Desulfamplus sp.]|nr:alpha/beta fold hydrolase [Desulfamplus sp.]